MKTIEMCVSYPFGDNFDKVDDQLYRVAKRFGINGADTGCGFGVREHYFDVPIRHTIMFNSSIEKCLLKFFKKDTFSICETV